MTVCLAIDTSITQNKVSYPAYDISEVSSGTVSYPLYSNVTLSGTTLCGSVSPFTSKSFIPVLRNTVSRTAAAGATTTTTTTTTTTSSKAAAATGVNEDVGLHSVNSWFWSLILTLFVL